MSYHPSAPSSDQRHGQWAHPSVSRMSSQGYPASAFGHSLDNIGNANEPNSRIPGLDMAAPTASGPGLPVMPMMNQGTNSQYPQPISTPNPASHVNSLSMPFPAPSPAGQNHVPANRAPANPMGLNGFEIQPTTSPLDREEGEITDREDAYNPPMSVSGDEYEPSNLVDSEMRNQPAAPGSKADTTARIVPCTAKSPAQLRVQAQGALLGLAPHNIRYNELAAEGINPIVLRQLYEEVGIKVASPKVLNAAAASFQPSKESRPSQLTSTVPAPDSTESRAASRISPSQENEAQKPHAKGATTAPPSHAETTKPLERKELIARMLASKAAQGGDRKEPSPITTTIHEKEPPSVPVAEAPSQEKDTRVKEKNKAQTELARKRMEQLKKQGLMKAQAKAQPTPVSENQSPPTRAALLPTRARTHHPLPDRPPVALDYGSHLPGLSMAPTRQDPFGQRLAGQDQSTFPTLPRATQRKRPRASDFDDLNTMPNKSLDQGDSHHPEERLVIDISDDEFYGDDENDVEMADVPAEHPLYGAPFSPDSRMASRKPLSTEPYRSRLMSNSQSGTPQSHRTTDDENLRKKDLAIQEMHRKIAELEQRKRLKTTASPQAARAVSPRSLGDSPFEPAVGISAAAPTDVSGNLNSSDEPSSNELSIPNREALSGTPTAQMLASMNESQLENVRLRLLRKKEIESGLPSLEADLLKSEARLNDFKKEQEKLIADIAKGKKGRQELADELRSLGLEINGLSFEDIEAAQRRSQSREQPQAAETVPEAVSIATRKDVPIPDAHEPTSTHEQHPPTQARISPTPSQVPSETGDVQDANGPSTPQREPSSSSMSESEGSASESEGSAMDESNDSSSVDSAPVDPGLSSGPAVAATEAQDLAAPQAIDSEGPGPVEHPLPERPRNVDFESQVDELLGSVGDKATDARSESSASDAYEPPEPEPGSSSNDAGSANALPLVPPAGAGQADRLTEKAPVVDSTRDLPQIGLLNNEPPEDTERHFSAYDSPLKYFKAFRYHPDFSEEVSDGYRSLTYSHNIDPMKCLCPFESAGGVCNDRSCEFQHFRDMKLSDDKVLIQMSSLREGKTQAEKDKYIAGLKEIINHMRRDSVKDFISVAEEIVAYRRRFLQDPSRVLPL